MTATIKDICRATGFSTASDHTVTRSSFTSASAQKILGYQPRVNMEEGLRDYLSYLNQMRE